MRNQARATSCPLCGTPLVAMVDGRWVAMSLDEYRNYALTRLNPNQAARLSPDTCIGCHSAIKNPKPDLASVVSPLTLTVSGPKAVACPGISNFIAAADVAELLQGLPKDLEH